MANNDDPGFDGPSPDYVPDENEETPETVGGKGKRGFRSYGIPGQT